MNRTARRDQTRTKMVDNIAMLAMQIETLEVPVLGVGKLPSLDIVGLY